jgi:hypothetical protein
MSHTPTDRCPIISLFTVELELEQLRTYTATAARPDPCRTTRGIADMDCTFPTCKKDLIQAAEAADLIPMGCPITVSYLTKFDASSLPAWLHLHHE